ncbi:hypothetical protein HMPREF3205_00612, partial [Streptococcus pasteurianus]
ILKLVFAQPLLQPFFDVNLHLTLSPTSKDCPNLSSHAVVSYQGSGNLDNREIKLTK